LRRAIPPEHEHCFNRLIVRRAGELPLQFGVNIRAVQTRQFVSTVIPC